MSKKTGGAIVYRTRPRSLTRTKQLIVLVVGLTALFHVVTWAETRYRLCLDPVLALLFVQMASAILPLRLRLPIRHEGEQARVRGFVIFRRGPFSSAVIQKQLGTS